jgi:hypothetical protein
MSGKMLAHRPARSRSLGSTDRKDLDEQWRVLDRYRRRSIGTGDAYQMIELRPYEYDPIGEGEIRLAQLTPRCVGKQISLSISTFARDNAPAYIALSYEWADPNDAQVLYVGSSQRPLIIRKNLHACLKGLWHKLRAHDVGLQTPYFWADAICIDQTNIAERNSEVAAMGDIFSNAGIVYAWLGSSDWYSHAAFQRIRQSPSLELYSAAKHRIDDHFSLEILAKFCSRSFWYRVWIVQASHLDAFH